jgi:flagellar hook assembly protein FlgD
MVPVQSMHLYQNHPNPFNPTTTIPFTVPGVGGSRRNVCIAVYDVNGSLVKMLASGAISAGRHEVRWSGRNERGEDVASGVYFVRLSSGSFEDARKIVLLR